MSIAANEMLASYIEQRVIDLQEEKKQIQLAATKAKEEKEENERMEAAVRKKIEEDTIKKHLKDEAKQQNGGVSPKSESESDSESSSSSEDELKGIPEDKLTLDQRLEREVDRRY